MLKTIRVRVVPNAKNNSVSKENGLLKVRVTSPATDGKANRAVIDVLAEYFGVGRNSVKLKKGLKSRQKTAEVNL